MITYFKIENKKSEENDYKMLTIMLKSLDTLVFIASASTSVTLSAAGISLIVIQV